MLTMTATPIPRTLQMALGGVREMSMIATPPVDRLAVRTFVLPTDPVVLREAILREHYRGGQTFYVCPRIEDPTRCAEQLRQLVPEVKVAVANGRMPADRARRRHDARSTTRRSTCCCPPTSSKSGLDIPTANTLIVHRADMFGLSQLYQLRGRIGRGKVRGYAYFTLPAKQKPAPSGRAPARGDADLDKLGAGFQLAQPRSRHPRRRQSARRRAVRPYPARSASSSTSTCSRRRSPAAPAPAAAEGGRGRGTGRRRSRSARRC